MTDLPLMPGVMALGQFVGARLGAGTALKHGAAVIRPMLVVVSLALCVKLLLY